MTPFWYHFGMAITVRIPDELDAQLESIARARHISKHALILQGAELIVDRAGRQAEIDAGLDHVLANDAELLRRLADA